MDRRHTYPFTAIVGQDRMKHALVLTAVNPRLGGVLIKGQKGTAKSTAVRALAALLPQIDVVEDCALSCDPNDFRAMCDECRRRSRDGASPLPSTPRSTRVVELPVSASEDRVVGTLDIEWALKHGEKRFERGVLAEANRGLLYVDEVNLLSDHIVDVLLDAAAMGVNTVEREGISYSHPSRFVLVGTMNPEEGDLRPQLLDRFGLCVDVEALKDPLQRVEVIRRRAAFEADPEAFGRRWEDEEQTLREGVTQAQALLPDVELPEAMMHLVAELCLALGVHGHRADIVVGGASCAAAALSGRDCVTAEDIVDAAPLAFSHRMRKEPFDQGGFGPRGLCDLVSSLEEKIKTIAHFRRNQSVVESENRQDMPSDQEQIEQEVVGLTASGHEALPLVDPSQLQLPRDKQTRSASGRRQETLSSGGGRVIGSRLPSGPARDISLDATLRASALSAASPAAPTQAETASPAASKATTDAPSAAARAGVTRPLSIEVRPEHLRVKVRQQKTGCTILFCVDASGSMASSQRLEAARGAVLSLLRDAYQKRDKVGLVSFRAETADLLLPPTASVELAQWKLRDLPAGGRTPLGKGLAMSAEVLGAEIRRKPDTVPWLVLVTDGQANVSAGSGPPLDEAEAELRKCSSLGINVLVVDADNRYSRLGLARRLAQAAGGRYVRLDRVEGDTLSAAVRGNAGLS